MFGLPQAGSEIRQRVDSQRARNAYRDAEARVAELIRHYGAAAALTWLERGLPTEVTNSNASNARTNSR
jgi:hypothetical protein